MNFSRKSTLFLATSASGNLVASTFIIFPYMWKTFCDLVLIAGSVTTWGDPACGGNSSHVAAHLKSRAFQICYNEWVPWMQQDGFEESDGSVYLQTKAFTAFREGGQLVCLLVASLFHLAKSLWDFFFPARRWILFFSCTRRLGWRRCWRCTWWRCFFLDLWCCQSLQRPQHFEKYTPSCYPAAIWQTISERKSALVHHVSQFRMFVQHGTGRN